MKQHFKFLLITIALISCKVDASAFINRLRSLNAAQKSFFIAAPCLAAFGANHVANHEKSWRFYNERIKAYEVQKQKYSDKKSVNFAKDHPEAAQYLDSSTNDFMSRMQEASDAMSRMDRLKELDGDIKMLVEKRSKYYSHALLSKLRYGSLDKAIAAMDPKVTAKQ